MYCSKCGQEIIEGSEFCSNCGNKVGQGNEEINNKKKGLTKNQFFICLIIMIIVTVIVGICINNSIQNNAKLKKEQIDKKVEEEMRHYQRSTFDNPKGSLGEQVTYRISPGELDY